MAAQIGYQTATMLDTKGPEVRTAMLKDGKDILLTAGQDIIVVSVGSAYTKWEGYKVRVWCTRAILRMTHRYTAAASP